MPGISRRPYPFASRLLREDDGFGMIEVLVSMVLLTALALATFSLIDTSTNASAQVRSRSLAADIAHDDLNRIRQLKFSLASSASYQSVSSQEGVDGVDYQVTSTATWATDSGVETSCTTPTTAGSSSYLRIRSSVTWPSNKGNPVVADSIMAPRGKEANRTAGSLMVKVQDRSAAPVSGAQVDVAGQSLVTSAAGCVYFPAINAGQWPVTITKNATPNNYMDSDGNSPGQATASVVVGDVSTVSVSFDIPATYNPITLSYENGTTGAKWPTVSVVGQSKTLTVATDATKQTATSGLVFPFASGWAFYAGKCAGNNPALYASNFSTVATGSSIVADPGATVNSGRAYMRQLTFKFKNTSTRTDTYSYKIYAYTDSTYTQMAGCTEIPASGTVSNLAAGSTATVGPIDVPYGLYAFCADGSNGGYTSSRYSYVKYDNGSSTNLPRYAYHVMPSVSGTTLKASSPANDSAAPGLINSAQGAQTADQCS